MQRRIRPATLRENYYGTLYPSPTQRTIDISTLNGGLNLWDLDYRMSANQSPDLLNVYWKDGSLTSRPGQKIVFDTTQTRYWKNYKCYACYDKLWQGYIVAHIANSYGGSAAIHIINPETWNTDYALAMNPTNTATGVFYTFGDSLYYMRAGELMKIDSNLGLSSPTPYVPIVIVNRKPDGTGGSTFQDENRLSPRKKIRFTTDGTSTAYSIPSGYTPIGVPPVRVELSSPVVRTYYEIINYSGDQPPEGTEESDTYFYNTDTGKYYYLDGNVWEEVSGPPDYTITVNRESGYIWFSSAPPAAATQSPSNLEVTIYKRNEDAENSIYQCRCAISYGADKQQAVVCGGPPGQPNAYFWSGSTTSGMDPTYFPFDYYNYAGSDSSEYVTGFGKQQNMLVIFKEHSIGKSYFSTTTVSDEDYLSLPYTPINDSIGCDLPYSIQLIQNNLVFANTKNGVYVLLDSSTYGENTVKRISRNVNGSEDKLNGLLYDLRNATASDVSSFDDQQRYWIVANGNAYLWDYTISSYSQKEGNLSWFKFDNIKAKRWITDAEKAYFFLTEVASIGTFSDEYNDFGEAIDRRYTFAAQNFSTYQVLKDVLKVIFSVRADTDTTINITYKTDYETRTDKTPIRAYSWRLVPRDLTHRSLKLIPYAGTAVRVPRCYHVRHFQMVLTNSEINTDMSVVSAQIVYRYNREDR